MNEHVIIVAGGIGNRMKSDIPKQFIEVKGKTILEYTIRQFLAYQPDLPIIVVVHKDWEEESKRILGSIINKQQFKITIGGETRFHSVKNGLTLIEDPNSIIAVHDAARPLVSVDTIRRCFEKAKESQAAIPVVDLKDSIRKVQNASSFAVPRNEYKIVQTPQCFQYSIIINAYQIPYSPDITDDASLVEKSGVKISLVAGNSENIKITNPMDLKVLETLV